MQITQNLQAFDAYLSLSKNSAKVASSLQKLSSGYRINKAADDASGLVISQNLAAEVGGLKQATANAQDGISVVQTADGALSEVGTMLQRMSSLAVQSANTGSSDVTARTAAQAEILQLTAEIDQISSSTRFGAQALLDGSFGATAAQATGYNATSSVTLAAAADFQINVAGTGNRTVTLAAGTYSGAELANAMQAGIQSALSGAGSSTAQKALATKVHVAATTVGNGFALNVSGDLANTQSFVLTDGTNTPLAGVNLAAATVTAASGTGCTFQVGAAAGDTIAVSIQSVSTTGLGVNALDLVNNASAAITALNSAISSVSAIRGNLGAIQNRFQSTIDNLGVSVANLSASQSAIQDTDMAMEMSNFTSHQVLVQAGTAMLAQANQLPSLVLKLLG